jgi:hypothetical protein
MRPVTAPSSARAAMIRNEASERRKSCEARSPEDGPVQRLVPLARSRPEQNLELGLERPPAVARLRANPETILGFRNREREMYLAHSAPRSAGRPAR